MVSCGYMDDGRLRVWDYDERCTVAEILSQHMSHRDTIYNVCVLTFHPQDQTTQPAQTGPSKYAKQQISEEKLESRSRKEELT